MRYSLRQLNYFLAAAKTCSVKKAAELMNVSQPSISLAIAHLEDIFELQFFIRHHAQGLSLTPAGKRFMREASQFMMHAHELETYAEELSGDVKGDLEVGCINTASAIAMPQLISNYYLKYPLPHVNCLAGNQQELLDGLKGGNFELILSYDIEVGGDYLFESLIELPPYALLSPKHELANRQSISLRELAPHPMVFMDLPMSRAYFRSMFLQLGVTPNIAYYAHNADMICSMVGNNLGFSISNTIHLNHNLTNTKSPADCAAVDGTLYRAVPIIDKTTPLHFGLVYVKQQRLTRLAKTFAEHCRTYFVKK